MANVKFFISILIILFVNLDLVHSSNQNQRAEVLSKLIKDIIDNEQIASTLSVKSCWSKFDEFNFVKNIPVPIQNINSFATFNLSTDKYANTQWFFIDMNCKECSNDLSNVDEQYFAHPYRWILADASQNSIQNLTILPDSNIILAMQNQNPGGYYLQQGNVLINVFFKIDFKFYLNCLCSLQNWT